MKDKILKLVKEGLTYKEIQKELGCSMSTISYHCKNNNIMSKNKINRLDDETILEIKKLYKELRSSLKVSKILNISKLSVLKYCDEIFYREKVTDDEKKIRLSKNVIDWRRRKKIELVEYKGGECEKCGYKKSINALEFHHIDPKQKDFSISGKSWSLERLKKEVDKCIIVCANCHREIHDEIGKEKK